MTGAFLVAPPPVKMSTVKMNAVKIGARRVGVGILWLAVFGTVGFAARTALCQDSQQTDLQPRPDAGIARRVVAYYFHRSGRDATCKRVSAAVEDAFREDFAEQMEDGRLALRMVDLEDPKNRELVENYEITEPALVLADLRDGEVTRWKKLDKTATVASDPEALSQYLRYETQGYLRGRLTVFLLFLLLAAAAFALGLQTAIAPCPMATNIAAISFIGRRVGSPREVLLSGLLYAIGRTLTYVILAILVLGSVLSTVATSYFLKKYMYQVLGPILIVVAMFLLGLIRLGFSGPGVSERMQKRVEAWGIWGALLLGILFALSFCPLSASLFFGGLITISLVAGSMVILPLVFGLATALPVIVFAALIAFSAQSVGKAFNMVTQFEWWARRITGVVFLAVGIFFTLRYCLEVI